MKDNLVVVSFEYKKKKPNTKLLNNGFHMSFSLRNVYHLRNHSRNEFLKPATANIFRTQIYKFLIENMYEIK